MKNQFLTALRVLLVWVVAWLAANKAVQGANRSWDNEGGDGLWQNKTNWTENMLPSPGEDVSIGGQYNVTLSADGVQTIRSLNCEGSLTITRGARLQFSADSQIKGTLTLGTLDPPYLGTLHGAVDGVSQTLTLENDFDWIGGELSGDGVVYASRTIQISGDQGVALRGPTLNATYTDWSGKGNIAIGSSGVSEGRFNNKGRFVAWSNAQFFLLGSAQGFFNEGGFENQGNTTFSYGVSFHNSGTVTVTKGTLELRGGGTSTGVFEIHAETNSRGHYLKFTGGNYHLDGATFPDMASSPHGFPGLVVIDGAFVTVIGGVQIHQFELASGNLTGPGTLTVSIFMRWTGGSMTGTGVTEVKGGLDISGPGGKELFVRTLNSTSSAGWSGTGNIGMGGGAVFNNTGTFSVESDASFFYRGGTPATFNNKGNFTRRMVGGDTIFFDNVAFNNTGTVTVEQGNLELKGGGTTTQPGAFDTRADSMVIIDRGTYTLDNAAFFGAGKFVIEGNGTAEVRGTVATSNFILGGGRLTGAGTLDVFGNMAWTGGTMGGSGICNAEGAVEINPFGGVTLQQRTFNTRGRVTWNGSGNIGMEAGATFNNFGNFTAENDRFFVGAGPSSGTFYNFGTFTKAGSGGMTTFQVPFINTGSARAASGIINFSRGYNQTAGILMLPTGSTAGTLDIEGGSLEGNGNHTGNVELDGAAVRPGASPGTINITGNYTQRAGGVLDIEIAGSGEGQFDRLIVSQTASLAGTLNIRLIDGFQPAVGDRFTVLTCSARNGTFDKINGLSLPGGFIFEMDYGPNGVVLVARRLVDPDFSISLDYAPSQLIIRFLTVPGRSYRVEYADHLSTPAWQPESQEIAGDGTVKSHLALIQPAVPQRYYRVVQIF